MAFTAGALGTTDDLQALPSAARALAHLQIAGELRERGADALEICAHLLDAPGESRQANVETLCRSAAHYRQAGALAKASECLRRALREPPDAARLPEILLDLAEVLIECGEHAEAAQRTACTRHVDCAGAVRMRAGMLRFRATVGLGRTDMAIADLSAEIAALRKIEESLALKLERELWRSGVTNARVLQEALNRHRRLSIGDLPSGTSPHPDLVDARQILAAAGNLTAGEAVEIAQQTLRLCRRGRLGVSCALHAVWLLLIADEPAQAEACLEQARRMAAPRRGALPVLDALQGMLALRVGTVPQARRVLRDALAAARRRRDPVASGLAGALLADVLLEADQPESARKLVAEHPDSDRCKGVVGALLLAVRARLALLDGRARDAHEDLSLIRARTVELGLRSPGGICYADAAVAASLQLGEHQAAIELARAELGYAEAWGAPSTIALARGTMARCLPPRQRIPLLCEAISMLSDSPAKLVRAQLLLELGYAESFCRRAKAAKGTLTRAYRQATAIGATRIARLAGEELDRLTGLPGVDGSMLTAGEQRVAAMAASGVSNGEIAARLGISKRTVENNMHRIYGKLHCTREDLTERLAQSSHATARQT